MLFRNDGLERSAPGLRNHFDCPAICRCIRPGTRNPVGRASAKRSLGNRRALAGAGAPAALWRLRPCAKAPPSRSRGLASRSRGRGGIGRHARFRFWWRKPWGFKSLRPHHRRPAGVALIQEDCRQMQVTETLSDGLKRGIHRRGAGGRHREPAHRAADRSGQTLQSAGFRPGKVPMPIVRQRFGGAVTAEVLEESVNEATQELLTERELRPAQTPKLDVVSMDRLAPGRRRTWSSRSNWRLLPDIALPDFGQHRLDPPQGGRGAGDGGQGAGRHRGPQPDAGGDPGRGAGGAHRNARRGRGRRADDRLPRQDRWRGIPQRRRERHRPSRSAAPASSPASGTVGRDAAGESKTIEVTFPEDYGDKDLAGKQATFDITAKKLSPRGRTGGGR